MLGHDDISHHQRLVLQAGGFQNSQDQIASSVAGEQGQTSITAEGNKVQVARP
jgi:hypothetical protein